MWCRFQHPHLLDRHATYVALSQHRDRVDLHYGVDDFASPQRLVATLGRERGKDMASDLARVLEPTWQSHVAPEPGVVLHTASRALPDGAELRPPPTTAVDRNRLSDAVARHGRIVRDVRFVRSVGTAVTPEQRAELAASRVGLGMIDPHAARDLEAAMANDPRLIREAAEGRTAAVVRAMQLEADMRVGPKLRAEVFVQRWQNLERQRRSLLEIRQTARAGKIADTMHNMAKSLERDPQLESILRNRRIALGLPWPRRCRSRSQLVHYDGAVASENARDREIGSCWMESGR